ncbi:MAG: hypothetical protein KF708_17525, partial [Pirellulales bacterium]|nr:hypothetical protein [Pirellulales bacterium]
MMTVPLFRIPTALAFAAVALLARRGNWHLVGAAYFGCVVGIYFLGRPLVEQFVVPRWGVAFDNDFVAPASGALLGWFIAIVAIRVLLALGRHVPPWRMRPMTRSQTPKSIG